MSTLRARRAALAAELARHLRPRPPDDVLVPRVFMGVAVRERITVDGHTTHPAIAAGGRGEASDGEVVTFGIALDSIGPTLEIGFRGRRFCVALGDVVPLLVQYLRMS